MARDTELTLLSSSISSPDHVRLHRLQSQHSQNSIWTSTQMKRMSRFYPYSGRVTRLRIMQRN
jgi:hypothetical protein